MYILQRFHDYLARLEAKGEPSREQYRLSLEQAYGDFVRSDAITEKVFRVLKRASGISTIPLSAMKKCQGEAMMWTKWDLGDSVRVIRNVRNDGTFCGAAMGGLLIRRGCVGTVVILSAHFCRTRLSIPCISSTSTVLSAVARRN